MKNAQKMSDTQIVSFLSLGHLEAIEQNRLSGVSADVLELLEQDHAAIMEHLDRICESRESDLAILRPAFLTVQMMLVAHSLNVDEEFGRETQVFDGLKKFYNLPDSITFADAKRYLSSDSHVYAGSHQGLREWKEKLGDAGFAQLQAAVGGGQV